MTEKEKMLTGELYDANYNKNLIEERLVAKDRCFEYNNIKPSKYNNIWCSRVCKGIWNINVILTKRLYVALLISSIISSPVISQGIFILFT